MPKKPTGLKSLPAVDLFKSDTANAYFDVREHEAFYAAIKTVDERRNFHEQLNNACATFLEVTSNEAEHALVDELISRSLQVTDSRARPFGPEVHEVCFGSPVSDQDTDLDESLQHVVDDVAQRHPHGCELLKLKLPLDLDGLKTSYRAAVLKHHPDRGGLHEDMVAIVEAYAELHPMVLQEQFIAQASLSGDSFSRLGETRAENCLDYRYDIMRLLLSVHLEDWAVDRAFECLQTLNLESLKRTPYTQDRWRLIELTQDAATIAARLWIAGRHSDANWSLQVANRGVLAAKGEGLSFENCTTDAERTIAGSKSARLTLNSLRQADNAFRLGVIDRSSYEKLTTKFADERTSKNFRNVSQLERFKSFAESYGFIQGLPPDESSVEKVASKRLVPAPDYGECTLAKLTKDQKAEYAAAFGAKPDLELVRKYLFVRLQSLLETVILHHDESPASERRRSAVFRNGCLIRSPSLEQMEAEARFLSELGNNPRSKSVAKYSCAVADAIQFLRTLNPEDRAERLNCLRILATSSPQEISDLVYPLACRVESVCDISLNSDCVSPEPAPIELLRQLATHLESIRARKQEIIRAKEQFRKKAALKKKLNEAAPKKKRLN